MKNSPLSALVLISVAGLVGGVTWLASGDSLESSPPVVPAPELATPTVMQVSPRERKLQKRLDQTLAQIEKYKETGVVLPNGEIKTKDADGSDLWVHPELIEGVGRYGEPLYMMATYKRREAVPLMKERRSPPADKVGKLRRLPKDQTPITLGKKDSRPAQPSALPPSDGDGGSDASGGGSTGTTDKPGAPSGDG